VNARGRLMQGRARLSHLRPRRLHTNQRKSYGYFNEIRRKRGPCAQSASLLRKRLEAAVAHRATRLQAVYTKYAESCKASPGDMQQSAGRQASRRPQSSAASRSPA
jgi:hypothetical protein